MMERVLTCETSRWGRGRMEQIYYTQCPIGYGLGASNGFQIKRLGSGYPPSGDVRHLALRPFLPGSNGKQLAPGTLRYRRVGTLTEVAWLEPRSREYETERGQWGRPGGYFAHGLRLDPSEFESIACWPAGLYGQPCWRRSDPEPSRGRRPDDLSLGPDDLITSPDLPHVAPLLDLDSETLAALLARVAEAVRTGRTLVLMDDPHRLGPRIAALTFAFPAVLRTELTFSTYHDRPEELSGFRIHGTVPATQNTRSLLASLGPVVDLTTDRNDSTSPTPPNWARSLASWFLSHDPRSVENWTLTDSRARQAQRPYDPSVLWSDAWLDALIGLAEAARSPVAPPTTPAQWQAFARQVAWTVQVGLSAEFPEARQPDWWRPLVRDASRDPSARDAFWLLLLSSETWVDRTTTEATLWGAITAYFWVRESSIHREQRLNAIVQRITSTELLARFLDGLIRTVPSDFGQFALNWMERRSTIDPRVLLPLQARNAVGLVLDRGQTKAFEHVLHQAMRFGETLPIVLDLIADEAGRLGKTASISSLLADQMEPADLDARARFETWALERRVEGQGEWIASALIRLIAEDHLRDQGETLRDRIPPRLLPVLAESLLEVADRDDANPDAFPWAIEHLVLGLPETDRAAIEPIWAERYLQRIGSPLDLALSLRQAPMTLSAWLASARARIPFTPASIALSDDAQHLVRFLDEGDLLPEESLLRRLPATDRAPLLDLMIDRLAEEQFQPARPILERCGRCWPGAFDPGAAGIELLVKPIADLLLQFLPDPALWIESQDQVFEWLGLSPGLDQHLRHAGLASLIVAETTRITADLNAAWSLRAALLRHPRLASTLVEDLGRDLHAVRPARSIEVARRWTLSLDKGEFTDRFFEVLLNACDGPRLAVIVPEYSAELWTLRSLAWWSAPPCESHAFDLREGFAQLIPMAPLKDLRTRSYIEAWLFQRKPSESALSIREEHLPPLLPEPDPDDPLVSPSELSLGLSELATIRWQCVVALTEFHWEGKTSDARWKDLMRWRNADPSSTAPPVSRLNLDDRYAFVAWVVMALDPPVDNDYALESLARWMTRELGMRSRGRIVECLDQIAAHGIVVPADRVRLAQDLAHQIRFQLDDEFSN
ncbi:GAP1-M domain-containing protein [Tautonia marina]|uniref:GAP1-M domain-containing protein n=1 Tax=Tautonia marina TaxID=2653855 RepID=UPI0012611D5A|nr:hypothetical protein [Tautonia marina]